MTTYRMPIIVIFICTSQAQLTCLDLGNLRVIRDKKNREVSIQIAMITEYTPFSN